MAEIFQLLLNHLNTLGLSLNIIGTFLVIFYISKDLNEYVINEPGQKPGEKWHSLIIKHPKWLIYGAFLIVSGFLLSLIDSLLK